MLLPKTFPPPTTVRHYVYMWRDAGAWPSINHALVRVAREQAGRAASPTAGIIDSQNIKTTESGGIWGSDAGKKLKASLARLGTWTIQIVKHGDKAKGFAVNPHRWIVERTFAWPSRSRRLA